jgi:hypothetical protein
VAKAKAQEDPLVAKAFDKDKHDELARAVEQLSPDEALFFVAKLEAALKKRKLQIAGYLAAMLAWVLGMMLALAYWGTHSGFTGWVFLAPFAVVGAVLYGFGRWATRVGNRVQPPKPS